LKKILILLATVFLLPCVAISGNIALNADVTLNGTFFSNGWGGGLVVDKQTVVDGNFLPISTQWDQGGVWWDHRAGEQQYMTLDLKGTYTISSFIAQADDNDAYKLSYWNGANWIASWEIPAVGGYGLQTRPDKFDNTVEYLLATPIVTSMLKFEGVGGDYLYSVSEIQAFGNPVPEPATMFLLGLGLFGLAGYGKKKFK
jgi:hypothetical protein